MPFRYWTGSEGERISDVELENSNTFLHSENKLTKVSQPDGCTFVPPYPSLDVGRVPPRPYTDSTKLAMMVSHIIAADATPSDGSEKSTAIGSEVRMAPGMPDAVLMPSDSATRLAAAAPVKP